ncbi:MAG TPA: hypothetical protein VFB60_20425 [Ktedonobacteraceae bacterium]|nr:hypothetical protein [Ktedonobacteraceae bacterium]
MPVLEATDRITPKSILRHRPIGESVPTGKRGETAAGPQPVAQRASRPRLPDVADEIAEWQRVTTGSVTKQTQPGGKRPAHAAKAPKTPPRPLRPKISLSKQTWPQAHPLLYLGLGMLAMMTLWVTLSAAFGWFGTMLDDMRYGRPRTFQTDAWVGHNEQSGIPSHFIAINLNRHIEVIEISGGDAAHTHIYVGPQLYGPNDALVPVTLSFVDVNHDHLPDMIINLQGSRIVFINAQGGFRPLLPSERPQVLQFLQHLGP